MITSMFVSYSIIYFSVILSLMTVSSAKLNLASAATRLYTEQGILVTSLDGKKYPEFSNADSEHPVKLWVTGTEPFQLPKVSSIDAFNAVVYFSSILFFP